MFAVLPVGTECLHRALGVLVNQVCVDCGRADIGMAQHFARQMQVMRLTIEIRGERMSECVRMHVFLNARFQSVSFHHGPDIS